MTSVLHVFPAEILVTESYEYDIRIQKNDWVALKSNPAGSIDVYLPYDGDKYFSRNVADKLLHQKDLEQLRIGWLAIGEPRDWKGDWSQKIGADIIDVNIPLRAHGMDDEKWTADEYMVHLHHRFSLDPPIYHPIQIDLEVLDTGASSKFIEDYQREKGKIDNRDAVAGDRSSLLSFEILVQVSLPTYVGEEKDIWVELEQLVIAWPQFAPPKQIKINQILLQQGTSTWEDVNNWAYIPERNEIELVHTPIRLSPTPYGKGSPLTAYKGVFHVGFRFSVGELLQDDQLTGRATLKVKNLLMSGRDVRWVHPETDDDSIRSELKQRLHHQTLIKSTFTAQLRDRFANKRSRIHRRWTFPGVSFSEPRMNDIEKIFNDYGYRVIPWDKESREILVERLIVQPEQEPLFLWAYIGVEESEKPIKTTRERKEAGDDRYITEIDTKDLNLVVDAYITGPGGILALDIDQIMLKLKDHFSAVADLR